MVINPRVEMMPTEEKVELILQRFRKNLRWALEKSSFYKKKYNGLDIHAEDIKTLSDIRNLPVTTRDELIQASAFDLLTGPLSQTLRFNRTISGLYRGFTADDIARNIDIAIRPLASNDINKTSTLIICGNYSSQYLLDLHYAAEALGATVLPCNSVDAAIDVIGIFNATSLIISAKNLKTMVERNVDHLPPKIIVLIDNFQDTTLDEIEHHFHHPLAKVYMSKYFGFAGIIFTCEHNHVHVQDDYLYPEVVDNKLVITPLTFEAMPIIRFQTKLTASIDYKHTCECGRTFATIQLEK